MSNPNKSLKRHDDLLALLFREIRRDVHPAKPKDDDIGFRLMDAAPPT